MKKILLILVFGVFCFANQELLLNSANSYIMTQRLNKEAPFESLMREARAVIIFPSVKKIGFLVGGMGGTGIMVIDPLGAKNIKQVGISGGSLGLQIGYEDSSLVVFILQDSILNDINNSKIVLNADASFSFGDLGGGYKTIQDFKFSKSIYAYATNGGFFAGASFGGVIINISDGTKFKNNGYAYEQLILALSKF